MLGGGKGSNAHSPPAIPYRPVTLAAGESHHDGAGRAPSANHRRVTSAAGASMLWDVEQPD